MNNLAAALCSMSNQHLLLHGITPNTVLVPYSRRGLFIQGVVDSMGGAVDPKLLLDALERDTGELEIEGMKVRLSRVTEDLTVCVSDG